jgi:hypothetical protein
VLLATCISILYSCSKDETEGEKDLYPQVSQALRGKWYLRQSFLEEYRYDGLGKQQYISTPVGDVYFMEFTTELWDNVPGLYKVQDQLTGLARPDYGAGILLSEKWKVFTSDSLQIGPNRVRIKFISADSLAFEDAGSINAQMGWLRTWEFAK